MKKLLQLSILLLIITAAASAQTILSPENAFYSIYADYENGFIGIPFHTLQIGENATDFDYPQQGGQDILFPYSRYIVGAELFEVHLIQFLYQPLEIVTTPVFDDEVTIDTVTFTSGTPMELTYSFPFWRVTYMYKLINRDKLGLWAGGSLQLRNAAIRFKALDGSDLTISQNLGPVPAVSVRARYDFDNGIFLYSDISGLWASSAIINGADFDFEGSILDASLRGGFRLKHGAELFLGTRFLGGTAKGTSEYTDRTWTESESSYTSNILATVSMYAGITIK